MKKVLLCTIIFFLNLPQCRMIWTTEDHDVMREAMGHHAEVYTTDTTLSIPDCCLIDHPESGVSYIITSDQKELSKILSIYPYILWDTPIHSAYINTRARMHYRPHAPPDLSVYTATIGVSQKFLC